MSNAYLIEALRAMGLDALAAPQIGGVMLNGYTVPLGRCAGDRVDLALAIDYPYTPPVGLHIHAQYSAIGLNNVLQSALGADWQYWSRRYADWRSDRSPRAVVAYINRVLRDV